MRQNLASLGRQDIRIEGWLAVAQPLEAWITTVLVQVWQPGIDQRGVTFIARHDVDNRRIVLGCPVDIIVASATDRSNQAGVRAAVDGEKARDATFGERFVHNVRGSEAAL